MTSIGVLLHEMNGIAGDLVRTIVASHDDIAIVDAPMHNGEVGGDLADVDLVVTMHRADRAAATRLDRLLVAKPGLRALAIQHDGRTAVMYALVPRVTQLGLLTPEALVDFIRATARPEPTRRLL